MLLRDVLSQVLDEIKYRECFCDKFFIFVTVVMESNKISIIRIDARGCNDWSAKIAADIFDNLRRITFIGHSSNIKTVFMISVNGSF